MDGNGRWAKARGLSRLEGHRQGAETVRKITTTAAEIGIEYLTLYAFSVENWSRPKREIQGLMRYLKEYLKSELPVMQENNIRLRAIGRIGRISGRGSESTLPDYRGHIEKYRSDLGSGIELRGKIRDCRWSPRDSKRGDRGNDNPGDD